MHDSRRLMWLLFLPSSREHRPKRALPIRRNSPPSKEKEMDASAPALQCYCRIDKKARFRNAFIVNVNVV